MRRAQREERRRVFFGEMTRVMLCALARAAGCKIRRDPRRQELEAALVKLTSEELGAALIIGVARRDLDQLCTRLGYSGHGQAKRVVARLIAAVEDPRQRITRWRSFEDARRYARSLGLVSLKEWFAVARRSGDARLPEDVPTRPHTVYATSGWTTWGEFLGTGNVARGLRKYRPFLQAREHVRSLGVESVREWRALCRRRGSDSRVLAADIPSAPDQVYGDYGWSSYGDWLGNQQIHASRRKYRSYAAAKAFVRKLGIRTEPEWRAYCRGEIQPRSPRPLDIPSNPDRAYATRGWLSWGDFLGTGNVALYKRTFLSFDRARRYVRALRLDSKGWRAWCAAGKRPPNIPGAPDQVYRGKGWVDWSDFLGRSPKGSQPHADSGSRRARRRS